MAKTTSTTKAKTSTTRKKPAAKATAKTSKVAAKTTKTAATKAKRTTTKTTKTTKSTIKAATPAKVTASGSRTGASFLGRAQILFGAAFALLAVLAGFLMKNDSVQVLLGHLTKDELASRAGTVLAPAAHVLYEIEFRWLLVSFLVLAAVLAFLRGTRYFATETAGAKSRVQPLRWIDYGLTGAAAFSIAALLNGMQDLVALKLSAVAIIVAAFVGWMIERESAVDGKAARGLYAASTVLTVAPVLFLALTMLATSLYGMVRSPWYAYAAAAIVAIYLLATVRMQWNAGKKLNGAHDFVFVDRNYNRLAVLSKVALAAVLIIGLYNK